MFINIKNKKDLNRFYKLLRIYRTFIFKFTKFEIENDKYNVKPIVDALNIKSRKKRLEYIIDVACDEVDQYYRGIDLCEFKNCQCKSQWLNNSKRINGCCGLCVYQSNKGCTTKNLACKLFVCGIGRKKCKPLKFNDIKILKLLNMRQRIILQTDYFSTEKQVLYDLYTGTLIIGSLRMFFRFIINTIILIKEKKYEQKGKK
ncbi:MAG: hypothetical protein IJF92_05695 [Bacilli bacterium]|nr:hypothetical protein [Bacilli bacterium]